MAGSLDEDENEDDAKASWVYNSLVFYHSPSGPSFYYFFCESFLSR